MNKKITVILTDPQYLIRLGLKYLIAENEQIQVVAEAITPQDLTKKVFDYQPNVVIMDYYNSPIFSKADIQYILDTNPKTYVLIISSDEDRDSIFEVLRMGVNGFLTKHCDKDEIIGAIYATAKGEKFICNSILNLVLEKQLCDASKATKRDCAPSKLTKREIEIIELITQGLSTKEMAKLLNISHHTIYTHRKNILKKLRINSASELILYAIKTGIVET